MKYRFDFSREKSADLKETRGIGFEDIIQAIEVGNLIVDKRHPNKKKYPRQKLFVVKLGNYIYSVPYVVDHERQAFFLKTLYPSRKLTRKYLKNEKEKI